MSRTKRIISMLLVLALIFSMAVLVGCTKTEETTNPEASTGTATAPTTTEGAAPKEDIYLTYTNFSVGADKMEYLIQMITSFEKKNPGIRITNNVVGYGEHFTQLATQIAANNAPDCYELNMENFLSFMTRGTPADLGPLFDQAGASKDAYAPGLINTCSYKGKMFAVPLMYSTVVLIYNKKLFDQAGVAYPTKDWTWNDELEAAKKIRALGPDIWGCFQEVQYWEFFKTVQQNGGNLSDVDGNPTLNSDANVETLQYMVDRMFKWKVSPTDEERAGRPQGDLFKAGILGMFRGGVWFFTDFANSISKDDFGWDVQVEPGNKSKATHFFANVACVSANSKHQLEAFKFINAMGCDADIAKIRLTAQWEIPAGSDPQLAKDYIAITPPDNKQAVLDSMNYAVAPPVLKQFNELINAVNPLISAMASSSNKKTAKEVLDECQKAVLDLKLE